MEDGRTVDVAVRTTRRRIRRRTPFVSSCSVKCKRNFGEDSPEFRYLQSLANYCDEHGVVRMEQELERNTCNGSAWSGGGSSMSRFRDIHGNFVDRSEA